MFITEHDFELPKGYVDADGTLHRHGIMRLATAADEILPMRDPRVTGFPAYLIVILLSRVVLRLGTVPQVNAGVIEGLFAEDLSYLQQLYNEINGLTARRLPVECPACAHAFQVELPLPGGSWATP
ncbi:MAG TPA: hypothetical protein VFI52_04420 [Gemmatimonadaceae bacterium]|nr:hypothetical protein [Gemmatimonadaceae bacterium]